MTEQLIKFETAKLAKEKGFKDIIASYRGKNYYTHNGVLNGDVTDYIREHIKLRDSGLSEEEAIKQNPFCQISAPMQSSLQKWLREKHKIHIYIAIHGNSIKQRYVPYSVFNLNPNNTLEYEKYNTYEEALESGLQEALKLIK